MPFCSALFCEWMSQVEISPWLAHLKVLAWTAGTIVNAAAAVMERSNLVSRMKYPLSSV